MTEDDEGAPRRSQQEEALERVQGLVEALRRLGGQVTSGVGALPGAAGDVMTSFRTAVDAVPAPTVALDLLMQELIAKRALVRAMQEQLASFEVQLDVLERALVPLHEWTRQWEQVQNAVLDPLLRRRDG